MRLAFWRPKSIEEHLAPITKIVEGLKDHAEFHAVKKADHEEKVSHHQLQVVLSDNEVGLALARAATIASLI